MKKVIVTGASGFVGRALVANLLDRGFEIHAVARNKPPNMEPSIKWHELDLFDQSEVKDLLVGIAASHLVHLAWCATPPDYVTSIENLSWLEASLFLVRRFAESGGDRALVTGTCFEYDLAEGVLDEETTALRPSTPYGGAKHALQVALQQSASQLDVSVAWARLFYLYGPYEHPARLVPYVARQLLSDQPAIVTSGDQQRDYTDVRDVGEALAALIDGSLEGPVNVASGKAIPIREIVRVLADEIGRTDLIVRGDDSSREGAVPVVVADVRRIERELKWSPRFTLAEGLSNAVSWWREQLECESLPKW